MFLHELNWLAIVVAWIAAFIAGAVWFGPKTFFPMWWKAMGRDANDMNVGGSPIVLFGSTAIASLVQAVAVASVIHFYAASDPSFGPLNGLLTGLSLGVGFAAATSLSHRLFSSQNFKVWIIEVGSDVLNLSLMGLIIGWWR
jgi:RsiW-degrading membrane proteinase PrsW (M82 family)